MSEIHINEAIEYKQRKKKNKRVYLSLGYKYFVQIFTLTKKYTEVTNPIIIIGVYARNISPANITDVITNMII